MHRSAGFTLLELLVVIGVLSVLTGLSVGYLGRTDPEMLARAILEAELRSAQLTARSEGVPTDVHVRQDQEGRWQVQARLLQPVATFSFEPGERVLDDSLAGAVAGDDVPSGRFGHARRPREAERNAMLNWPVEADVLDLREGFVVRLDLKLDRRQACSVLRLPPTLELLLDDELRPRARFRVRAAGGDTPSTAAVASEITLPLARWCTIDVGCDGRAGWLMLDGREIARGVVDGTPQQEADRAFQVSPPEAPLPGAADEVRWFVYTYGTAQDLPIELEPERPYRFTFDARGEAVERPAVRWLTGEALQ